jgi:hypothetical protein
VNVGMPIGKDRELEDDGALLEIEERALWKCVGPEGIDLGVNSAKIRHEPRVRAEVVVDRAIGQAQDVGAKARRRSPPRARISANAAPSIPNSQQASGGACVNDCPNRGGDFLLGVGVVSGKGRLGREHGHGTARD